MRVPGYGLVSLGSVERGKGYREVREREKERVTYERHSLFFFNAKIIFRFADLASKGMCDGKFLLIFVVVGIAHKIRVVDKSGGSW